MLMIHIRSLQLVKNFNIYKSWILYILILPFFFSCTAYNNKMNKTFQNWKKLKENKIVMQQFDFSCGAAALATLLTYYFEDPVSEQTILLDIMELLPKDLILNRKQKGLSLLDLKKYCETRGYKAYGVKLKPSSLLKLTCPILIYLEINNDRHFSILRGFRGNRVVLADSNKGNVQVPIDRFL